MKEDTVLSDRIDLCRIFIFFVWVCVSSTTTERGPTRNTDQFGGIFFIFSNILVIIILP